MNTGMRMVIVAVIITASFAYMVRHAYKAGFKSGARWVLREWKKVERTVLDRESIMEMDEEDSK